MFLNNDKKNCIFYEIIKVLLRTVSWIVCFDA